jgi:acyl-ACP thioesterase
MNNTRYLDWIMDLLPSDFHRNRPVKDFTLCYMNEALEGQDLTLTWDTDSEGCVQVDILRPDKDGGNADRIFAAKLEFDNSVL